MKCLVTRPLPGDALGRLSAKHEVNVLQGASPPAPEKLLEALRGCSGMICTLAERVDERLLDAAGDLLVVSNYAVGSDNVDLAAARQRGVAVGVTPDVLTAATADLTFALLLAVARKLPQAAAHAREGRWRQWDPEGFLGLELAGATIAIVGPGRIGREVRRRAEGFRMRPIEVGRGDDLLAALSVADVVSLHTPLTETSRHLIDERALRAMKRSALLINTARGAVVDQAALLAALREGRIGGAGIDVTDPEPPAIDDEIFHTPNLLVLPHIGSATHVAREAMADIAVENLLSGLEGRPLPHPA